MLKQKPQAILFDLDGTLAHTLPQLGLAVCQVARKMELPEPDAAKMSTYVGNGVAMLLGRVILGRHDITLEEVPPEKMAEARAWFSKFYAEGLSQNFYLYEGVLEGIKYFHEQGIQLATVTNKPDIFAQPLMRHMGLAPYMSVILGGEVLKVRKPDPAPLLYVLDKMGVAPEQAVMVGDSINDVKAGENAHVAATVALTYGYNGGYDLKTCCHADYMFDHFTELTALIKSLP